MLPSALRTTIALGILLAGTPQELRLVLGVPPLTADKVRQWAGAVASHEPGRPDAAAATVGRLSGEELFQLFRELLAFDAFKNNPLVRTKPVAGGQYPDPQFEKSIVSLLQLTAAESQTGNINRFLLRAVVLHTDVQILSAVTPINISARGSPFSGHYIATSEDGKATGIIGSAVHTEFASWLLDGLRRDPSTDGIVQLWYQATAAQLILSERVADASWLVERGLRLFPDDIALLFLMGTIHETMSTPRVQAGLRRPSALEEARMLEPEYDRDELKSAKKYFARALEIYPGYLQARLHLGRVVGLLDDHTRAIELLSVVTTKASVPEYRYYAAMFLAREQDAVGNSAAAREELTRALELFPYAQSALLALSELARRNGDTIGSRNTLNRLLTASGETQRDPLWSYSLYHVADAPQRLQQWRDLVGGQR